MITTIQRLYSMLQGRAGADRGGRGGVAVSRPKTLTKEPLPVVYNAAIPAEFFDFIVIDECHRSIYTLWRQVLEYFDAFLVGLTATPAKQTFGFFNQNIVMEYDHERAVADGVNVDFEVYRIRTEITEQGATIDGERRRSWAAATAAPARCAGRARRGPHLRPQNQLDRDVVTGPDPARHPHLPDKLFDRHLPRPHARCPRR